MSQTTYLSPFLIDATAGFVGGTWSGFSANKSTHTFLLAQAQKFFVFSSGIFYHKT